LVVGRPVLPGAAATAAADLDGRIEALKSELRKIYMDIHEEEVKAIIDSSPSHDLDEIKLLKELHDRNRRTLEELRDRRRAETTSVKAEVNKDDELVIGKSYRTVPHPAAWPAVLRAAADASNTACCALQSAKVRQPRSSAGR